MTREEVYKALDSERGYQAKWGDNDHSPEEFFMYMEDYINEAKHILSREANEIGRPRSMDIMRKVTALGVAAIEQHGCTRREGF